MTSRIWGMGAVIALALALSGCLTVLGSVAGGTTAHEHNKEPCVQTGDCSRASVAKGLALGAGIGIVLDVALIFVVFAASGGPGRT